MIHRFLRNYGYQIRNARSRLHISQKELANQMNDLADELGYQNINVSEDSVSTWERGTAAMNVVQEDLLIRILLTNVADLHSIESRTDLDNRLDASIKSFSFRHKQIMYYLIKQWDGNCRALLEANLMYAAMPEDCRATCIEHLMAFYNECKKTKAVLSTPVTIDFDFVEHEQEKL